MNAKIFSAGIFWSLTAILAGQSSHDAMIVEVPSGVHRVRVDYYDNARGEWIPLSTAHLDGRPGQVKVHVDLPEGSPVFRAMGSGEGVFPTKYFWRHEWPEPVPMGSVFDVYGLETPLGRVDSVSPDTGAMVPEATGSSAAVVESDIWKVREQELYFFNQLRGLQVFDLSDGGDEMLRNYLRLPQRGEEMYFLDDGSALLLANDPKWKQESEVVVVRAGEDFELTPLSRIGPLGGRLVDSRMVGSTLHLLTEEIDYATRPYPVSRLRLFSISFGNPASPRMVGEQSVETANHSSLAVSATDNRMLVAVNQYQYGPAGYQPWVDLHLFALDEQAGATRLASTRLAGAVKDKFKLQITANRITAITEVRDPRPRTELHNLSVSGSQLVTLGHLTLAQDETLHATRLVGDRAFIVTFLQIDPLFIVDLSVIDQPKVLGSLDIPGWSTYIEPLGDRLLSVGVESGRVAVSLFGITNPAQPQLLDRVYLSPENESSWSEALYDERAVTWIPDKNLLLVPYQKYEYSENTQAIRLIEVGTHGLTLRGDLPQDFVARRSTLVGDELVAISGSELTRADARDRDAVVQTDRTRIAWSVQKLLRADGILCQLRTGDTFLYPEVWFMDASIALWPYPWFGVAAELFVTSEAQPDRLLGYLQLPDMNLIGATLRDGRLYTLHTTFDGDPVQLVYQMVVTDLTDPGSPKIIGESAPLPLNASEMWSSPVSAHWIDPHTLLWTTSSLQSYIFREARTADAEASLYPIQRTQFGSLVQALAFDTTDPTMPRLRSSAGISGQHMYGFTPFIEVAGRFYASYRMSTPYSPAEVQKLQYRLIQLDPDDPDHLDLRDDWPLPGDLIGAHVLAPDAAVLFTRSDYWDGVGLRRQIQASAWDSSEVLILDRHEEENPTGLSLMLGTVRFRFTSALSADQALMNSLPYREAPATLERTWFNTDTGKFADLDPLPLAHPVSAFSARDPWLLLMEADSVHAYDTSSLGFEQVSRFDTDLHFAYDLNASIFAPADTLWLVAGAYGVERAIARPIDKLAAPRPSTDLATRPIAAADLAVWSMLTDNALILTSSTHADQVGRMVRRQWLFRSDQFPVIDPAATDHGNLWQESSWFGFWGHPDGDDWIYHRDRHWLRAHPRGTDSLWLFAPQDGWLWTSPQVFPWFFRPDTSGGQWVF